MPRVQNKVAIITGAAVGLGEASARLLAREGAKVVLTDIKDTEGERAARSIMAAGGEALYLHHDVADESAGESVIQATLERFGRLDVLVNNAGVGEGSPPEEQSLKSWRRLMSINLDGVFLGTKHAIRAMKLNTPSGGSIINLSSIEGIVGDKSVALYCGKSGLNIRVSGFRYSEANAGSRR